MMGCASVQVWQGGLDAPVRRDMPEAHKGTLRPPGGFGKMITQRPSPGVGPESPARCPVRTCRDRRAGRHALRRVRRGDEARPDGARARAGDVVAPARPHPRTRRVAGGGDQRGARGGGRGHRRTVSSWTSPSSRCSRSFRSSPRNRGAKWPRCAGTERATSTPREEAGGYGCRVTIQPACPASSPQYLAKSKRGFDFAR